MSPLMNELHSFLTVALPSGISVERISQLKLFELEEEADKLIPCCDTIRLILKQFG